MEQKNKIYLGRAFSEEKTVSHITVRELYEQNRERLSLTIINNKASFNRKIKEREIHRPGLALSGFIEVFTYWRIQVMGNAEIGYLNTLQGEKRISAISTVLSFDLPCIIITGNNKPPEELKQIANEFGVTLFSTPLSTTAAIHHLRDYLDDVFAPHTIVHGSMVEVHGVGVLITGDPTIGKSELALDLVERGHQLVADDVVKITRIGMKELLGEPSEVISHHMEIRGLGIIDIRRMFGIRAIRGIKTIDIVVKLERFDPEREYERIGLEDKVTEILSVDVPIIELPILPGKNLTVITEAIALNHKLKQHGEHAAREFNSERINRMKNEAKKKMI